MRSIVPPGSKYTAQEIADVLAGLKGPRRVSYRFERLDKTGKVLGAVDGISDFSIEYNALADIKRTCTFQAMPYSTLNYLTDRIRPWWRLAMPDGGIVEWPQGVFLLSTPARTLEKGYTSRKVDGYDRGQILTDDTTTYRETIPEGKLYTDAIREEAERVLGYGFDVTPSPAVLPAALEHEPGTPKAKILGDLLAAINYSPAHFDENGTFKAIPYTSPATTVTTWTYNTDERSVVGGNPTQTLDLFSIPNRWILVRSDPDVPEMVASYVNENPASPTSTVSRGRIITDFRTEDDAANLEVLAAKARRLGEEASQVFEEIEFETLAMPFHGHGDVYLLGIDGFDIEPTKFSETKWTLEMKAGSMMKHTARRVVTL
jgi:hypothetical protein